VAKNPYRQGGLATPPPELDDADESPDDAGDSSPDDSGDDSPGDAPADEGEGKSPKSAGRSWSAPTAPAAVNAGAGWVLGLLLWGWVVLPFVKGGPAGVKAVFLSKFLNKAPDGSRLP
jgi:hypothetical protein